MTKIQLLKSAIDANLTIEIVYFGGSKPGTKRKIIPISVAAGKIRARCHATGVIKQFLIDKISFPDKDSEDAQNWETVTVDEPAINSVDDLLAVSQKQIEEQGWHISHSPDHISLHRCFKNGKPMKGWEVCMDYEEMTHDEFFDLETLELKQENHRKRVRPWTLRGKGFDTRTYKDLAKAHNTFIEWASLLAPKPASSSR